MKIHVADGMGPQRSPRPNPQTSGRDVQSRLGRERAESGLVTQCYHEGP